VLTSRSENTNLDENCNVFQFSAGWQTARVFVVVTGLPGSGKSSVAAPLARTLDLPLLAKDTIKEALWDALGPGDRAWARTLGGAAATALVSLAQSSPGAVIDHFVHADTADQWAALPGVVEVHCSCAISVARERYRTRRRHPCHFDAEMLRDDYERWIGDDAGRPPLGPRLEVDTTTPVDIAPIARWVTTLQ